MIAMIEWSYQNADQQIYRTGASTWILISGSCWPVGTMTKMLKGPHQPNTVGKAGALRPVKQQK